MISKGKRSGILSKNRILLGLLRGDTEALLVKGKGERNLITEVSKNEMHSEVQQYSYW